MTAAAPRAASRHLLFKGLAALVLGFPLALWLSWLLIYGGLLPAYVPVRDQIAMWLAVLLWGMVPCLAFLAPSRRAWWPLRRSGCCIWPQSAGGGLQPGYQAIGAGGKAASAQGGDPRSLG